MTKMQIINKTTVDALAFLMLVIMILILNP
jgi:hypothetical protein